MGSAHRQRICATKRIWIASGFLVSVLGFKPSLASAQASLAAEDIIDEVPVTIAGVQENFTVLRDAHREEQWYYVPDRPRLFERVAPGGGSPEPDFTLLRFQFQDPANPEALIEGGLLQFAMSLALPPEALPQLKEAIGAQKGVPADKIRLSALPMDSTAVHLYVPEEGQLIASQPQGPGIAPTFATQKVAFSVPLTRIGSDVFDALVNGNTGIAVGVEFNYNGLSPAAGFRVTVDWDMAYTHYSKDQQFAASASYLGLFGAKAKVNKQQIYDELVNNKVIDIEVIEGGSGFGQEEVARYLDPIVARINKELVENMKPPEQVEPAKAEDPNKGGWLDKLKGKFYIGGGYSVAIKKRKDVRRGKEIINFKTRQLQVRRTVAAGFLGIGRYPEELRQRLVTVVPPGPWKSAYFILPNVGDAAEIGIKQVDLQIRLKHGDRVHQTQVVRWTPDRGWAGRGGGTERTVMAFGLLDLRQQDPELHDLSFENTAQITLGRDVFTVTQQFPVDDEQAIVTPLSLAKVVSIDGSLLTWQKLDESSELVSASVALRSGDRSFSTQLKPRLIENEWALPLAVHWIVGRPSGPVEADIQFRLADGSIIPWSRNGENLAAGQEEASDLFIELIDADWNSNSTAATGGTPP